MKTESSAKIKFEDKYGKGTDFQGQNITIGFI